MSDQPDNAPSDPQKPADQAEGVSPISGTAPPAEHRWKPGQSGNPRGRQTAGASIKEWMNRLAEMELSEVELRKIATDPKEPWPKRTAAVDAIKSFEFPNLADYAGLLRGENNLEDLPGMGVSTTAIKRFRQKTRKVSVPGGDGAVEEVIDRDIELHDRAGQSLDRIADRTDGRPKQQVDVTSGDQSLRTLTDGQATADQVLDRLRGLFNARPADPA